MAAYIGRVLVHVCMLHISGVVFVRYYSQVIELSLIVIFHCKEVVLGNCTLVEN